MGIYLLDGTYIVLGYTVDLRLLQLRAPEAAEVKVLLI